MPRAHFIASAACALAVCAGAQSSDLGIPKGYAEWKRTHDLGHCYVTIGLTVWTGHACIFESGSFEIASVMSQKHSLNVRKRTYQTQHRLHFRKRTYYLSEV